MGGYRICFAVSLYHSLYYYRYPLFKILLTFICFDNIFLKCFIFGLKRTCGKIQNRSKCLAGCWLSAYSHDDIILAKPRRFVKSIHLTILSMNLQFFDLVLRTHEPIDFLEPWNIFNRWNLRTSHIAGLHNITIFSQNQTFIPRLSIGYFWIIECTCTT